MCPDCQTDAEMRELADGGCFAAIRALWPAGAAASAAADGPVTARPKVPALPEVLPHPATSPIPCGSAEKPLTVKCH